MGNGEPEELTCTILGYELRAGHVGGRGGYRAEGDKEETKNGTTVIAQSIKYT